MSSTSVPTPFGYSYLPGVSQYSASVRADAGYSLVRCRLATPAPVAEGFDLARDVLAASGMDTTALCATELRSPEPFTEEGFVAFNATYIEILREWGVLDGDRNPIARSNVCPVVEPPAEPSLYAFTFARPDDRAEEPTFVVSGSGEAPEGMPNYADHIVAPGDTGPAGMRAKAEFVVQQLGERLTGLGFAWSDVGATQLYTVHDSRPAFDAGLLDGALSAGLLWHYCRPPINGLDFEMDCHRTLESVVRQKASG